MLISLTANAADWAIDWEAGQHSFALGDYASALHYFESARDLGQSGPAVDYNIAVCQYKLGDHVAARDSFQSIAERYPRMQGLAEYNLGLTENRLGNTRSAQRHFVSAYRLSPDDEKLQAMAADMLRKLDLQTASSSWFGSLGLRGGYDDNVALRDSLGLPAGVTSESPMADFFGSLQGPVSGLPGMMLDASAYLVTYADASEFDQSQFELGGSYLWQRDDWRAEGGIHFIYGTLGGSGFEREVSLSARVVRYLNESATIDLRYRHDDIDAADPMFDGIAGSRHRFDIRYYQYIDRHRLVLRYGLEANDRLEASVSPQRSRIGADLRFQAGNGWGYEASLDYRDTNYDDLETPRSEELISVSAALTREVDSDWFFSLRYRFSDNESSDPQFSYQRSQITLGALRLF